MTGTGALLCRVFGSSACPLQKDWEIRTRPAPRRNSPRETRAGTKTCQIIPHRSYRKRSQRSTISMRRRTSFWTRWRPRSISPDMLPEKTCKGRVPPGREERFQDVLNPDLIPKNRAVEILDSSSDSPSSALCLLWQAPRPPVPVTCNTKERGTDHDTNEGGVNQHGDRQRKSDHLDHQETSEGECRKYHDHDRGGARNQACGSSQTFRDRLHFTEPAPSGFENACHQKYLVVHA